MTLTTDDFRFIFGGFGTPSIHADPCKNIFQRFFAYFSPPQTDNTNVNIWPIGDKVRFFISGPEVTSFDWSISVRTTISSVELWWTYRKVYSFTETCCIREVDPMTLESPTKEVINQYVTVNHSTAHPHSDPDGTVYNMGSTFGKQTFYNIFKYPGKSGIAGFHDSSRTVHDGPC